MTGVLVPAASEAEWLEARRKGVTASEIAVVMGLSPYSSPFALYHRKLGNLPEQEDDMAMAIGRHFEDFVADRFAELRPEFRLDAQSRWSLYAHSDRPWQMATPDRIIDEDVDDIDIGQGVFGARRIDPLTGEEKHLAVLECKTDGGFDGWGEDGSDEIPVHYRCQVLWQMDVMDVSTGYVACLFMNRRQLRVYELTMDDQARSDLWHLKNEALNFLDRIQRGEPPEIDWRPATSDALKHLHPDVEDRDAHIGRQLEISYRSAIRRHKEAERRKDEMTNRLREAMGSAHRAVAARTFGPDGNRVDIARRDVYDVKEHVRRASHVDKIVPVKPKQVAEPEKAGRLPASDYDGTSYSSDPVSDLIDALAPKEATPKEAP